MLRNGKKLPITSNTGVDMVGAIRKCNATVSFVNRLSSIPRDVKQHLSWSIDASLVVLSLWIAYSVRLGEAFTDFSSTWHLFMFLPVMTCGIFWSFGAYRWVVRSTTIRFYSKLTKGAIASALALLLMLYLLPPERLNPRSIFIIYGMTLLLLTVSIRAVWQWLLNTTNVEGELLAIYGAGAAGQQLVSILARDKTYNPVLFLDDDPELHGRTVGGLPVINPAKTDLEKYCKTLNIKRLVLAMPNLATSAYNNRIAVLSAVGLPVMTMPCATDILQGKANVSDLRDISIADILGRTEVAGDSSLMRACVEGAVVLVTGGGGSIGSEICRQVMAQNPELLLILDHSEHNLYCISEELESMASKSGCRTRFESILCSVTDKNRIEALFSQYAITTVFHAAAYKHVPIVEKYPEQGVDVNVFGTRNVLDAAVRTAAKTFVLVSTDKAVRPTNAMGATKRVAELVLQARAVESHSTCISMVRFGNVLGSSGSVVPKFRDQILAGGPVTLTDRNITRYFMSIPEAAQLVMQAGAIARGGEVFVLDMGEPVRIEDLALSMINALGKRFKNDHEMTDGIEIKVSGLRSGEKMFEELFTSNNCKRTRVHKILTADERAVGSRRLTQILSQLQQMSLAVSACNQSSGHTGLDNAHFARKALTRQLLATVQSVDAHSSEDRVARIGSSKSNKRPLIPAKASEPMSAQISAKEFAVSI